MAIPASTTPAGRFLACEHELDRLGKRLESMLDGRGGLVLVVGAPGVGVTSLAREAAARAEVAGVAVLWGRSLEGTLGRPYSGLADALEAHASGLPPETVVADMGDGAGVIVRICPGLARTVPALTPAVALDPEGERLRLFEAVSVWLQRMAMRQPLLIVVDDARHADRDLSALLEHLARRMRSEPVLIICTATDPVGSGRGRMPVPSSAALEKLELGGLDEGATAALLAGLADLPIATATVALVQQVTDGSPTLSIELFRHLSEERLIPGIRGGSLPELDQIPHTLAEILAWRLARQAPETRATLNVLAAFPEGAPPHIAAAAAGLTRSRSGEAIEAAIASGLATAAEHGTTFSIAQPAIAAALLETLSPDLRARLHRRVAEAIAAESDDRSREMAGMLAHHYAGSGAQQGGERGVRHCLLAAEQARSAYAYRRQVECLRWAHDLARNADLRTRSELLGRLASAEASARLRQDALRHARTLLEQTPGHAGGAVLVDVIETLRALRGTGVAEDAWPDMEALRAYAATRAARADPLAATRLQAMAERWQTLEPAGVPTLVWSDLQPAALKMLWGGADEIDRAEVMLPQRPRNRAESIAALEYARAARRPQTVLRTLDAAVTDLIWRHGLFAEGASWAAQYVATAQRFGSLREHARALLALGRCQTALGELNAASATLEEAARAIALIPEQGFLAAELVLARAALAVYDDGAWPDLLVALGAMKAPRAALPVAASKSLGHARLGHAAEARESLAVVLEATAQLPPLTLYRDAALVTVAAAAWEAGAAEHAAAARSLAELAVEGGAGGQIEGTLGLTLARMFGLGGQVDAARHHFGAERAELMAAGLRPLAALCDHDEAIAIAAAGPRYYADATRLLQSAADQFRHLGMNGWLQRANEMLGNGIDASAVPDGRLWFSYPCGLTPPEADVVRHVADGLGVVETATRLEISRGAVDELLAAALERMGATTIDELPALARRHGLGGV